MTSDVSADSEFFVPEPPADMALLHAAPPRAMVVCAHPDDAEIGCGATLAKWAEQGCAISLVVCTGGQKGVSPGVDASIRVREQESACALLGVATWVVLDHEDGALEETAAFRGEIVELIRRHRPQVVLTHDPLRSWGFLHRDHRITGIVASDAVYPYARDTLHYPEQLSSGLKPHNVREVLQWGGDTSNAIVDVSGFVARQVMALREHGSQLEGLASTPAQLASEIHARARKAAARHAFEHGEVFRRLIARG